jgi:hypothetical protein
MSGVCFLDPFSQIASDYQGAAGGKHSGWPSAPTSPCGAQGKAHKQPPFCLCSPGRPERLLAIAALMCEQCADAGAVCDGSQQGSLGLMASSGGLSADCRTLFGLLMSRDPSVTVDSPELCDCWPGAQLPSCDDAVCDCTLTESSPLTVAAAAAVCAAAPPPAPPPAAVVMTPGFCDAVSAGGSIVAACQHGRCTQVVNDSKSPSQSACCFWLVRPRLTDCLWFMRSRLTDCLWFMRSHLIVACG